MADINVLLLFPVEPGIKNRIQAVSPELKLIEAWRWMPRFPPTGESPDPDKERELDELLARAEILYGIIFPPDVMARAPGLKWIQTTSAGIERALTPEIAASRVILTNVSGMHAVPISELVFTFMLDFAKQRGILHHRQGEKKWERTTPDLLAGRSLGIIGLGHIGRRIAALGKAFGMRVTATRRHILKAGTARNVDAVYPRAQLPGLLAESDYVLNCLPATPETRHLSGEAELRTMKAGAVIINIGRGSTIDETALIKALQEKWIGGAGLDTFEKEPLPPDSPLWEMPNVIITPHISGSTSDYMNKATDIFCDNLRRYLAGKRLKNIVNKKLGY